MGPLLLDVGSRDNLGGQVKPLPEVVETLGGEGVVVVLPRELRLDVAARGQGLASLDDEQVADAGLVGRLIAAEVYELASAATRGRVLTMTRWAFSGDLACRVIVAETQPCRSKKTRSDVVFLMNEIRWTYSFAATITPSRKRYCLEC